MIQFILRLKHKLPLFEKNVWYNSNVYDKDSYPKVFTLNNKYIECKRGVELLMGKTDKGNYIYYKVVDYTMGPSGDYFYESDRIKCTLKFSRITKTPLNA